MLDKHRLADIAIDEIARALPYLTHPCAPYLAKLRLQQAIIWIERIEAIEEREAATTVAAPAAE